MSEVLILKKRKDFVRVAAKGVKVATSTLILQAAQSLSAPEGSCRTGYTTTKKIGKAHVRNRTRRRMRAAVRELFPARARPGVDYVLIGQTEGRPLLRTEKTPQAAQSGRKKA